MAHEKLKKGYDIKIDGISQKRFETSGKTEFVALKPDDFTGLKPRLLLKEGDAVKVGTPLFHHKENDSLVAVSPVSGSLHEIIRGDRRKIEAVVVKNDGKFSAGTVAVSEESKEEIITALKKSGIFITIRQRPYGIIPDAAVEPRDIFISLMNTAPLAAEKLFILQGREPVFQKGLDILSRLTSGSVHLVCPSNDQGDAICGRFHGVTEHTFSGPHPAENPGVHIHHIAPVKNRKDIVWTVPFQTVLDIGYLFTHKKIQSSIVVAVAGPSAATSAYYEVIRGASVASFVDYDRDSSVRIISGDVLTGSQCDPEGYISWNSNLVSVIPEAEKFRFIGWLMPGITRPSFSRTFVSWFLDKIITSRRYVYDTGTNGGTRAFIVTGEMEKVLPMDIYPVFLLKSILAEDIEEMESLGIYEVVEEDFALCEYIDPSKNPVQSIIRQGINLMMSEG